MTTSTDADIAALWVALASRCGAGSDVGLHQRVDAVHPLDFYAGFNPPDRPSLLLVTPVRPPAIRPLRAVEIEVGRRSDGRYAISLSLTAPRLKGVFARLCADLVTSTRIDVAVKAGPTAIAERLDRWRRLMEGEAAGLSHSSLRGLIGELLVLRDDLMPTMTPLAAVSAWTGPLRAHQDFICPDGNRIEVKTIHPNDTEVKINGLSQLDGEGDALTLVVIRLAETVPDAPEAITAPTLVTSITTNISGEPLARSEFDSRLAAAGWHEHPDHAKVAGRVVAIERHNVGGSFPRLTRATVPASVTDADYTIIIPPVHSETGADLHEKE